MFLNLESVGVRYPGARAGHAAVEGVSLALTAGQIGVLIGPSGCGKTTLLRAVAGLEPLTGGRVRMDGRLLGDAASGLQVPPEARGIGMVFQAFMLATILTVWENIVLGDEPGSPFALNARRAKYLISDFGEHYGLVVDPDALISDVGVGDKQRVEILKVLYRGAKILILDEPTAVLVPQEVDALFASLRELTSQGATVIFISHKLDEVLRHADAITVIRQGKTVGEIADPSTVTSRELAEMMVGSELPTPETRDSTVTDEPALELRNVTVPAADDGGRDPVRNVTFTVHRGEIVGIAGVEGNGQSELVRSLVGLLPSTGDVLVGGDHVTGLSTRERRDAGIGYISEDRQKDGLVLGFTLWENAALGHHHRRPFAKGPWFDIAGAKARAEQIVDEFDVRTPGIEVPAFTLSGGNQQKIVLAREMEQDPGVLIVDEPTRGVDVGAIAEIHAEINRLADAGKAVVVISSYLPEILSLSDRILVAKKGKVVEEFSALEATEEKIMYAAIH
jgi:simple sugar transport system ATP-binding protein